METAVCGSERRGTPTLHGEVENNLMWRAANGPLDIGGAGQTPPQIPAEAQLSPRRALKHGAYSHRGRARRAEVDALIARTENAIVRANMTTSVRRASRALTKARCLLRTLQTWRVGRMANGGRRMSQEPLSLLAIRYSPFGPPHYLPSARGWRPTPWSRHTLEWSPLGGVSTRQE